MVRLVYHPPYRFGVHLAHQFVVRWGWLDHVVAVQLIRLEQVIQVRLGGVRVG